MTMNRQVKKKNKLVCSGVTMIKADSVEMLRGIPTETVEVIIHLISAVIEKLSITNGRTIE